VANFEFAYLVYPSCTNNQAEYEAVFKAIQLLHEVKAEAVEIFGDSLLVVDQLIGKYECSNDVLKVYLEKMSAIVGRIHCSKCI
jgi:ribonuclease HI